jgi:hypothetical protein
MYSKKTLGEEGLRRGHFAVQSRFADNSDEPIFFHFIAVQNQSVPSCGAPAATIYISHLICKERDICELLRWSIG